MLEPFGRSENILRMFSLNYLIAKYSQFCCMGPKFGDLQKNQEIIERVHLFAIKKFLGVHVKAPRHLVYGETGRFSLFVMSYVKFWLRLLSLNNGRYSRKAYNMLLHLQSLNYDNWTCNIRNMLYMHGFGVVWEAQGVGNTRSFIACWKERLIDCWKQNWHSALLSHDFYNVYTNFNQSITICQYLITVKNVHIRRLFSRFRLGMSDVNNHFLQYKPNLTENKNCPFCKLLLETEIHFLLVCPMYNELREELIPHKYYKNPSLSCFSRLIACAIPSLCNKVALFVFKAFSVRQEYLKL